MAKFFVPYEEALELLLENAAPLGKEKVLFTEALGRVLAQKVYADRNFPEVPLSAMDGWAVSRGELPGRFRLAGEFPAGSKGPLKSLKEGEALTVFTGSPVPKGTYAVVPFEQGRQEGEQVVVDRPFNRGANVRPVGEDFREGQLLLEEGTVITPSEVGLLATVGAVSVEVFVRPKVALFATGNEVVEPWEQLPERWWVRNANAYSALSMVLEAGAQPSYLGLLPDDEEATFKALSSALERYDLVVTSGGVSAGHYDFVKKVIERLGLELIFYKVKVKPGKPVLFAKGEGNKALLSLPGFPVSTVVAFYLFAWPYLKKLQGAKELFKKRVKGRLVKPYRRKKAERKEFFRAFYHFNFDEGVYSVEPLENQSSGAISALRGRVALGVIPEGVKELPAGSSVELILIKE